jgi:DSF synthase
MQSDIYLATATAQPFRYFVVRSSVPGVFNLGGDLDLFGAKIRSGDRDALRTYAHACVDVVYTNAIGYDRRLTTVALVQGAALGGGFEAALSCHHIIAERSATFGLPEVLVDLLVEDGEGDAALRTYLAKLDRRYNTHQAVLQARHRVNPLTREELIDIVNVWVDAALQLNEADLRKMGRLVRAQTHRHGGAAALQQAAE